MDNIHWHYEKYGDPANHTLILLHGFAGSSETWAEHIPYFSKKYHTFVIDLPGHGKTNFPSTHSVTFYNLIESLIKLIEYHTTFPRHVLGYSMGGRIATRLIIHSPSMFSSAVLISCGFGLSDVSQRKERIDSDYILADKIKQNGMEWFTDYWQQIPLFASRNKLPEAKLKLLTQIWLQQNPEELAKALELFSVGNQPYILPQLSTLSLPILFIAGELDSEYLLVGKKVLERVKNSKLNIIGNCGHDVPLEAPVQFRKKVLKFLNDSHIYDQS